VTDAEIFDKLTNVLRRVFDDDRLVARPELTADDVEGWNSLTNIRFILSVERVFGLRFTAGDVAGLQNVGDLARLIHQRI
jgi:acyl carrier protein